MECSDRRMPCPDPGIGTDNRWFAPGSANAIQHTLTGGRIVRLLGPSWFMAAKIEASRDQGRLGADLDWYGSSDLEDLLSLVDGLADLAARFEGASTSLKAHCAAWSKELLGHPDRASILAGNATHPARTALLEARLQDLSRLSRST